LTLKDSWSNLYKRARRGLFKKEIEIMQITKFPKKIFNFFREVKLEMKKIDWPSKKQVLKNTLIVIGVSLAIAIFLGGLDFIFTTLLNKFVL